MNSSMSTNNPADVLVVDEHFGRILREGVQASALDVVVHAGQLKDNHTHINTSVRFEVISDTHSVPL